MQTGDLTKWMQDHNIKVLNSNKRVRKFKKPSLFNDPSDYNNVAVHVYDSEPLLTLEIPESDLQKMAEFESQVFNNMREQGHYNIFVTMLEQKQEEKELRKKNDAVQKAYEHYSLLLHLTKYGN